MVESIICQIEDSIRVKKHILEDEKILFSVSEAVKCIKNCFEQGNKVILFGNGGSAADAQHIAAEFIGRFKLERKSYPAIAITTDSSALTSISNDYGYDAVFCRQVEGLANKGDVVVGISTSGRSPNVIKAFEMARNKKATTIALIGKGGDKNKNLSDIAIVVPSIDTPRIQEAHILIGHIICDLVEKKLSLCRE